MVTQPPVPLPPLLLLPIPLPPLPVSGGQVTIDYFVAPYYIALPNPLWLLRRTYEAAAGLPPDATRH